MHVIIVVLAALVFFLFLTLAARRDPEQRKQFYLYTVIDLVLAGMLGFLLITGVLN